MCFRRYYATSLISYFHHKATKKNVVAWPISFRGEVAILASMLSYAVDLFHATIENPWPIDVGEISRRETKDSHRRGTVATWKSNVLGFTGGDPAPNKFVAFEFHGGMTLDSPCDRRAGRRLGNQVEDGGQLGGAVGAVELIDASPGAVWLRLIAGSGFGHGDGRCGFGVSKNPPRSPLGKGGGKRRFVICT